jgi:bacteriocin-like protein
MAITAKAADWDEHLRFSAIGVIMNTQHNDVRELTEKELSSVAGGMFMDASVQIMGKTLHVWASSDFGISGAYWTRVWDGNAWR